MTIVNNYIYIYYIIIPGLDVFHAAVHEPGSLVALVEPWQ